MLELGIQQKPNPRIRTPAPADIVLEHDAMKHVFVTDVMIKRANIRNPKYGTQTLRAAKKGVKVKFARFIDNYERSRGCEADGV
jgi:hypothetical protein